MNSLLKKLKDCSPELFSRSNETKKIISPILYKFQNFFPEYTDHSVQHSETVLDRASLILKADISQLNESEIYVLVLGCYLHDVGMAPSEEKLNELKKQNEINQCSENFSDYLREVHQQLSHDFVIENWELLKIPNKSYAQAIAKLCLGHRKADLIDFMEFPDTFPVETGKTVNIPYLTGILKLADELDITNERIPEILFHHFYPTNLFSQQEWEKHKVNWNINVCNANIVITGEVTNQFLYERILEQHNKISQVLDDLQKICGRLPFSSQKKFSLHKIESHIKTIGFKPIKIGFTFDPQNTLETLVGKNLYGDKLVAIREALSNSIDSCKYKKSLFQNYNPEISIYKKGDKLIVEDNALGMDEDIVKNYFSKLASSYYSLPDVQNTYESIGQFGIGVYSYFLICDKFDVKTKKENAESLSFRVTKDALSYFTFFDEADRNSTGTTITFYLTEELNVEKVQRALENYIRFVDIPIKFFDEEEIKTTIAKKEIDVNKNDLIDLIRPPYHDLIPNLMIIKADVHEKEYDAVLGLILEKEKGQAPSPRFFSSPETYSMSSEKVEISQKGIYIGSPHYLIGSVLKNSIVKVNFKSKQQLSLERSRILSETVLVDLINELELEVLKKLFGKWNKLNDVDKTKHIKRLIYYSFHDRGYWREKLPYNIVKFVEEHFLLQVYKNNKFSYLTLKSLLKEDSFLLASSKFVMTDANKNKYLEARIDIVDLSKNLKLPILYCDGDRDEDDFYFRLLHEQRVGVKVVSVGGKAFYLFETRQNTIAENEMIINITRMRTFPFEKGEQIIADLGIENGEILNSKHSLVKYLLKQYSTIENNSTLMEYMKSFFETIKEMYAYSANKKNLLHKAKQFLKKINTSMGTDFKISSSDFF